MAGKITNATAEKQQVQAQPSVNQVINSILDNANMRKRFDELLDKRTPQFISSLVTLLNATPALTEALYKSPMTIVQAALKAASYDLPIDPSLGFAYIVPFKNKVTSEAQFILGYKGMIQLALRTGAYKNINAIDIRAGELKSYNRLTEEIDIDFIQDDEERAKAKIIGWAGYLELSGGFKKTIYMSVKEIKAHELKHQKGDNQGWGWKNFPESMARKTVLRKLISNWGLMSIDYQRNADQKTLDIAANIASGNIDDEYQPYEEPAYDVAETSERTVTDDGEIIEN
ncbi:hypothetical protein FACS1894188_11530 [Clostridia bacterium]|nr:hypothetical protein FACS1894188_11530 [Clostridia bacterium]